MTVVSEVTGVECDEREYPWLGFVGGAVVLFSGHSVGTVVADDGEGFPIGYHGDDWDIDMFDAFPGRVTLSTMASRSSISATTKKWWGTDGRS